MLPAVVENTLHAWRSIGGFGAAKPPVASDVLLSRAAFGAIDDDDDGFISPSELTTAVLRAVETEDARSLSTRASVQQLVSVWV